MDEIASKSVHFKLKYIQKELKVNKNRGKGHDYNAQVTYEFRNAEDILEAVKPLCDKVDAYVRIEVEPFVIGESVATDIRVVGKDRYQNDILAIMSGPRYGSKSTAYLVDCNTGDSVKATAFAFIDWWRKGQTEPEKLCGSSDSYASKYALQHLFALDNGKDDPDNRTEDATPPKNAAKPANAASTAPSKPRGTPKAQEAWKAFKALGNVAAMSPDARNQMWAELLKEQTGKTQGAQLTDADWDKVINQISIMEAM